MEKIDPSPQTELFQINKRKSSLAKDAWNKEKCISIYTHTHRYVYIFLFKSQ